LPWENRSARDEFNQKHVVGARLLDLNEFMEPGTTVPNMLLREEHIISQKAGELGITNDHKIIFYDRSSHHTSCRALWMFKVFGHPAHQLYLLDGGFDAWEKFGGKIEEGEPRAASAKPYEVNYQAHFVRALVQMKTNLHHPTEQVVDLRHPVRFAGGAEPRKGIRPGHIPGSISFPFFAMFESDGKFKSLDKIRKQLTGTGLDLNYPIVSMCGSGMTAAILDFVLDLLNHSDHALYDGSWSEWGSEELYHGEENLSERPVITSLEK
jgi:thiosulfate/3-mercaptopyruvate sulfurtransferase